MDPGLPARVLAACVRGYQLAISPWLPPSCRFYPSCSQYSIDALRTHGALKGLALTAWRLLRCQPFHPGGLDPVPPPRARRAHPHRGFPLPARLHHQGRN